MFDREDNKNYTMKEVCEKFNVSRGTVYNWMKKGLKSFVIGGSRRFNHAMVKQFIKKSTEE